jgi:hypothetical protein
MWIKVLQEYEVQMWIVPNSVRAGSESIPVADISATDLSMLCDEWRAEVFKRAGKQDPRLAP